MTSLYKTLAIFLSQLRSITPSTKKVEKKKNYQESPDANFHKSFLQNVQQIYFENNFLLPQFLAKSSKT